MGVKPFLTENYNRYNRRVRRPSV